MNVRRTLLAMAALTAALATPASAQAKANLLCAKSPGNNDRVLKPKPRACDTLAFNQAFTQAANLSKLKWSRWGKSTAYASGVNTGYRAGQTPVRVKVRVYRLRKCPFTESIYTRMVVRRVSNGAKLTIKFPAACTD